MFLWAGCSTFGSADLSRFEESFRSGRQMWPSRAVSQNALRTGFCSGREGSAMRLQRPWCDGRHVTSIYILKHDQMLPNSTSLLTYYNSMTYSCSVMCCIMFFGGDLPFLQKKTPFIWFSGHSDVTLIRSRSQIQSESKS